MKKERILHKTKHNLQRLLSSAQLILLSIITGCVVGGIGTIFALSLDAVTNARLSHPYLLLLLPIGAVCIVGLYHLCHYEKDAGTNLVLAAIHSDEKIPLRMAPLIFLSTLITHLCGGSAGREGAALQLGGSIGNAIGELFHFNKQNRHIIIMCGMSAAFSALFGTPLAAAVFSMEVISVGIMHYAALVPCVISALIGHGIATYFGVTAHTYVITSIPAFGIVSGIRISILAILCGLVSILFCATLHQTSHLFSKWFKNPWFKAVIGGTMILLLTILFQSQTYNGTGMSVIESCIQGTVAPETFLVKIIFTAITLSCGYKGGEIVPTFFIGASFGCLAGNLMGFSPSLCAAVGMGAVFCGVTNCPITSLLICFELFGLEAMPYFLLAIAFSYLVSGYYGLYSSQKIVYSKYKSNFIDKQAQ